MCRGMMVRVQYRGGPSPVLKVDEVWENDH